MKQEKRLISLRGELLQFAAEHFGTEPDYPWESLPTHAVLRHGDNKKWYALFMSLPKSRLGLAGEGNIDALNLKCDPVLIGSLRREEGFLPAYHMNRESWITILLDGTVDAEQIFPLLEMSFELTASRRGTRKAGFSGPKTWLVPANPKYFDLQKAFSESDTILWKQSSHIAVGDTVFLYVAAPFSAILYQCRALEVNIPYQYDDENVRMSRVMRLQREREFAPDFLTFEKLKDHGVFAVRGPRSMPDSLLREIEFFTGEK
ncbi:MAG: MmcQ/YjbR family DNA-binding protein [Acutalibacter sp.]|nr:MmcQ/YjbR family DNA-binding protein [Acutalibacter sp.]